MPDKLLPYCWFQAVPPLVMLGIAKNPEPCFEPSHLITVRTMQTLASTPEVCRPPPRCGESHVLWRG